MDSDSDEDDVPDLLPRGQAPSSDSSSESEGELPPLVPRYEPLLLLLFSLDTIAEQA